MLARANWNPSNLMPFRDEKTGKAFYINKQNGVVKAIPAQEQMAQNAVVPLDAWKSIDTMWEKVRRERLVMFDDALATGSMPLGSQDNALGTFQHTYAKLDDPGQAKISMEVQANKTNKTHDIEYANLPLPLVYDEFSITGRQMHSLNRGQYGLGGITIDLDMSLLEGCYRRIAEEQEELLIDGGGQFTFAGSSIYGYTNFPDRNTYEIPLAWDNASKTGALILTDVLNMIKELNEDHYYGPFTLYIPSAYETVLDEDFKAESDRTIRDRILALPQISSIKVVDRMPANNVVLVQLASDVVQIVDGFAPSLTQWNSPDGLTFNYYVMAMQIPLLRSTYSGQCGFCHGATA